MKSIKIVASTALLMTTAMIGTATAQNQPAQQGGTNPGAMMGFGVMGPGMMGPGVMGPGMMGMLGPGMMGGASGPAMCSAMAGHIDGRLTYVKAELKITDAQEALWIATPLPHATAQTPCSRDAQP